MVSLKVGIGERKKGNIMLICTFVEAPYIARTRPEEKAGYHTPEVQS